MSGGALGPRRLLHEVFDGGVDIKRDYMADLSLFHTGSAILRLTDDERSIFYIPCPLFYPHL